MLRLQAVDYMNRVLHTVHIALAAGVLYAGMVASGASAPAAAAEPQRRVAGVQSAAPESASILTAEQEAVARRVEEQLMAPCCFGGTIATHHSPKADEMRADVRARVVDGATEQEILDAYLARYGERILAQPVARGFNLLAYWMPVVGLLCGSGLVLLWLARRRGTRGKGDGMTGSARPLDAGDARFLRQLDKELAAFDT